MRALSRYAHEIAAASPVRVALHTDHCSPSHVDDWLLPLLAESKRAFAGSTLPLDENLRMASALLVGWSELDVILEIESGVVGGEQDGIAGPVCANDELYTASDNLLRVAEVLGTGERGRYLVAATFGNVHGTHAPGNVVLRAKDPASGPAGTRDPICWLALRVRLAWGQRLQCETLQKLVFFGVVKVNVDTVHAWARRPRARPLAGVLKVDERIGDEHSFDPRV